MVSLDEYFKRLNEIDTIELEVEYSDGSTEILEVYIDTSDSS